MKKFFLYLAAILMSVTAMAQEQATARVLVPSDCSMDVSKGLWLAWFNDYDEYNAQVVPMKQEGRIFTASFTPTSGQYGYYFQNTSSTYGEGDARTYPRYSLSKLDTICWEMYFTGDSYNLKRVDDCALADHNYLPYNLAATPLGRDSILFTWEMAQEVSNEFMIRCYDESGRTLFEDVYWAPAATARSFRAKANTAVRTEVARWEITARDQNWNGYTAQGAGFVIDGDSRIPHDLKVTANEGTQYTISWEAGNEVDHFSLRVTGLETPIDEGNLTAKSKQVSLPDNGYYTIEVESRDAENKALGIVSTNINTAVSTVRDLVLHFYIPAGRDFASTSGYTLVWRNALFAGDHEVKLEEEEVSEEAPHWYKATIKDFNRVAILFSVLNASPSAEATKEVTYQYPFGEYESVGYYALAENLEGELYLEQQNEYVPWYPKDYTPKNLQISQKLNKVVFQWESAASVNYQLKAYDKSGEFIWTTVYSEDGNQYEYTMDNTEPVEILQWSLTPQVSYNYVAALAAYSRKQFTVQPSPLIPKNLKAVDNGDGTYTFSWDKVALDTVKQYRLNIVDPSGEGVLGRYNLTTTSVTEPIHFIFSGRGAIKVTTLNQWGSNLGTAIDSFTVNPVAARDINIRMMINPMSGVDTSEGVQFEIKKDAKSAYTPVAAVDDKYGWWKYTLNTTEPGAIVRIKGAGWRTLNVFGDTCVAYTGSYYNEEDCDAHDDDYMPQNISVYNNNDGTYTIAWTMNYTEQVNNYRVDLYDENYNYYLNTDVKTLQVKTPVLATAGKYTLNITVYNQAYDRIGYGTTSFVIKPVEARNIQLSVLAQPGTPEWAAYTYDAMEGDYSKQVVFTPAEGGWLTTTFNTTEPALMVRFRKSGGWYYSEPTDIVLTEKTCVEWDGKEFKKVDCETAKLNNFTLSNLKVEDKGKGNYHFSWDCESNPSLFNIRLLQADSSTIHWSTNVGGEDRSADYQFVTDSTMGIVWYVVPVMEDDYDNNYLWELGAYGKNFTAEATMQKLKNVVANKNANGTWTIQWDKLAAAVTFYVVEIYDEKDRQLYYNSVKDNKCTTNFISKIGTHKVTVNAYDNDWTLLGKGSTTLTVSEVAARELTVRLLLHPDAETTISPMRCQTGPSTWEVADPVDQGNGWYKFSFTSTMPAPEVIVLGFQPTIYGDTCMQFTSGNLYGASCDEVARDYRILPATMNAVSEAGRVTFSWSGIDKATSYEVRLYTYNEQYSYWEYIANGMTIDTAYVYIVPDDKDGMEIKWSVTPRQPHSLKEYEAAERVILHKSQILVSSLKAMTTDSVNYRLSWSCNTDTVQYQIQVRAGGYMYVDRQLTKKQFDYTALSGYQNYNWQVRAVNAAGEPLTAWVDAEPFDAKASLRMVSNLQGSATGKTLRFSWSTSAPRVRAELWLERDTWSREPIFPRGDSIITAKTFSITVEEDARYEFSVVAQVENKGEFVDVYEDNRVYVNVFNDVKTYAVNVSTTTGGFFWGSNPSGNYPEGYEIMLRPNANEGYWFVKWSDGVMDEFRRLKVTSDTTLIALYEKIPERHVVLSATAGGVLRLGYYDRLITKLDTTFVGNWSTRIEAQPNEGYELYEWSDGSDATESRRYVNLHSDTTITAVFKPFCYVAVSAQEGGRVQISGAKEYDKAKKAYKCSYGAEVTIKANPNDGYRFVKWSDGSFNVTRTITVTKDVAFTAEFAEASTPLSKYAVLILSNDIQLGEVSQVSGTYTEGDKLTIIATPQEGTEFVKWSDGNLEATRVITVSSDTTLIAYFQYRRITIAIKASAGGTVNATEVNGTYDYGTILTLKATPDEHYHFVAWSDGNTESNRMITLKEDVTLTATFAKQQYLVTFLNADGAYIESNTWNYGDRPSCSVVPTMAPDKEWIYTFTGWTPEIKAVTANAIYTAVYSKTPNPAQGIDDVQVDNVQSTKVLINGQLFIFRDGKMYNAQGALVK